MGFVSSLAGEMSTIETINRFIFFGAVVFIPFIMIILYRQNQVDIKQQKLEAELTKWKEALESDLVFSQMEAIHAIESLAEIYPLRMKQKAVDAFCEYLRKPQTCPVTGKPSKDATVKAEVIASIGRHLRTDNPGNANFDRVLEPDQMWNDCDFDLSKITFEVPIDWSDTDWAGKVTFAESRFEAGLDLREAVFLKPIDCTAATFLEPVIFDEVCFTEDAIFAKAIFGAETSFNNAKFISNAVFKESLFLSGLRMETANFLSDADFMNVSFVRDTLLYQSQCLGTFASNGIVALDTLELWSLEPGFDANALKYWEATQLRDRFQSIYNRAVQAWLPDSELDPDTFNTKIKDLAVTVEKYAPQVKLIGYPPVRLENDGSEFSIDDFKSQF